MNSLPEPLTPPDCDLRDFPYMPLDISRLFNSEFHAQANDAEWRAGLTLWLKSFHQVPCGSIPDDDVSLARLAELGRDVKSWKKVRAMALHGWVKCSDGRLYHPVVAEKARAAWDGRQSQRGRTCKGRLAAMLKHLSKASDAFEFAQIESNTQTLLDELSQYLLPTELEAMKRSVTESVTEAKLKRELKEKGNNNSVPNGTGAGAPGDAPEKTPEQMTVEELWRAGKSLLMAAGMPKDQCGTFVGKLCKDYGNPIVIEAVRITCVERPADPASYLKACCMRLKGHRPNRQESLEAKNRAIVEQMSGDKP